MLTFILLNLAAGAVAVLVARVANPAVRPGPFALTGLCGYLLVVHTVMLVAGLAGWLTASGVAVVLAILLAAAAMCVWRSVRGEASGSLGGGHISQYARPGFTAAEMFAPLVAVGVGALWAWPHVFEATRLWIWDDYTYHMVYPALWLGEHAIAPPAPPRTFTMQAWYPLSASVVASWFMLPLAATRGDALAWVSLTGLLYAAIVVSATVELVARLGGRRGAWAVPLVLLLTSHRVTIMASSFSDADLAHAAVLFAAIVLAIPRGEGESPQGVRTDAWYAALLTGLAIGVKVSAAPVALIVLAVVAIRSGWRRTGVQTVLVFVIAWSVTGAYWYARNWWHAGNPLYPAAFLVWAGETFPHTTLREYGAHYGLARTVRDALAVYLDWPVAHAVLALAGLAGIVGRARRGRGRATRFFAITAPVVCVVVLLVLPSAPYSAGNSMTFVSGFIHWDSMRYVALLPLLGWAALGILLDAGVGAPRRRTVAAIAVTTVAVLTSGLPLRRALALLAISIVAAAVVSNVRRRARDAALTPRTAAARGPRVAVATALAAAVGLVSSTHAAKAGATAAAIHGEPLFGPAASVLDRELPGTRVAVFGDQWIYPAFGERGHLQPVRLDANGRVASLPIGGEMTPGPLGVDATAFGANLRAAGIGVIVIVHMPHPGRAPAWPSQHAGLQKVAGASRIHEAGGVSVWRLDSAPR